MKKLIFWLLLLLSLIMFFLMLMYNPISEAIQTKERLILLFVSFICCVSCVLLLDEQYK